MGAPQFPMSFQFAIYCRLHGEGEHTFIISVTDPNGNEVVHSEPITAQLLPVQGHQFFMSLGLQAEHDGLFKVRVSVDGELSREVPLLIEKGPDEWHPN